MQVDVARGIRSPSGETERGIWSARRPSEHTAICWASALGRAHHLHPGADPALLPDRAIEVLAAEPGQCKCSARNKGTPGRRAR